MITNEEIMNMLLRIEKRLDNIENALEESRKSADKMTNHIDFIDNVYDTVKKPLCRILSVCNGNTVILDKKMITN
jgi:hypothetical protein